MNGPDLLPRFWFSVYLPNISLLSLSENLSFFWNLYRREVSCVFVCERESGVKMMLGKRGRPPMKRTTSMTEFTLDLNTAVYQPSDLHNPFNAGLEQRHMASPRPQRRNSADYGTANFLRVCALCQRRLIPGHDIYMYRGDSAFCSLECRNQQMTQDERKEKCSTAGNKKAASTAVGTQVSATGETVPAV